MASKFGSFRLGHQRSRIQLHRLGSIALVGSRNEIKSRNMALELDIITLEQAKAVMRLEESQTFDFKAKDIAPDALKKTISAFANADGGELYIGITEPPPGKSDRVWNGFPNQEAANGHINSFETTFPLGTYFQYSFLRCADLPGVVLKAQVNKTDKITLAANGIPYLRRGAQSIPQSSPEQIKRLEYAKGVSTYETEQLNVDIDLLTESDITKFFMESVVPSSSAESWLRKQALIRNDRPNVAGTLLFADIPQAHMPKRSGVKIYRYKTKDPEGFRDALAFDPETIEGPLYSQIRESVARTVHHVEKMPRLGDGALESITYPQETLHEIITNALIHRDYSIADDVHIRIFDNRIEVQSPGRLAGHVTIQNVMKERAHRNGSIVRVLNKFPDPPNKDVGEGLNTAFRRMNEVGLKSPVLEQTENSFLVIIKHEPLAVHEETIMDYLVSNETIKNSQARIICHVGADYVMKRIFAKMIKQGLIEQVPGTTKFTTMYRKVLSPD